jgi:predicted Zn-dependent protease
MGTIVPVLGGFGLRGVKAFGATYAALSLLVSCADRQQEAAVAAQQSIAAFESGNLAEAERLARLAVQKRDSEVTYWQLLAAISMRQDRLLEAYQAYSRVIELDASNLEALQIVSEIGFQIGDYRRSEEMADRILVLDANSTRALLVKGLVALEKGKAKEANEQAQAILKLNSRDEFGIILVARANALQGKFAEAVAFIESRIPIAERTEASLITLIELNRRVGDFSAISQAYAALIAKRPEDGQTILDYAQILYRGGNNAEARSRIYGAITAKPATYTLITTAAQIWADYDQTPLSPAQLKQISQTGSPLLRIETARYFIGRNDAQPVSSLLQPLLTSEDAQTRLEAAALNAHSLLLTGKARQAEAAINDILTDDQANDEARLVRSMIRQKRGDLAGALEDAQLVVSNMPENERARTLLASIIMQRDGKTRALQSLEEGFGAMPQSNAMAQTYTEFLVREGMAPRAIDVGRRFSRANPSSVKGWQMLLGLCRAGQDSSCASQALAGLREAQSVFTIDTRPGTPRRGGLFGNLKVDCGSKGPRCT